MGQDGLQQLHGMEMLKMKLVEVKFLYYKKFGTDVGETYDSQLHRCQDSLCKLEALFVQKYAQDIHNVDEDRSSSHALEHYSTIRCMHAS